MARTDKLPSWPRWLRTDLAASYLSLEPRMFKANVPVSPVARMGRIRFYDRKALDEWADSKLTSVVRIEDHANDNQAQV